MIGICKFGIYFDAISIAFNSLIIVTKIIVCISNVKMGQCVARVDPEDLCKGFNSLLAPSNFIKNISEVIVSPKFLRIDLNNFAIAFNS